MVSSNIVWLGIAAIGAAILGQTFATFAIPGTGYIFEVPGYAAMTLMGGYLAFGGAN